ncbi:MAG: hypothetical protein NVSMB1_08380 [Polyangiales bacterium]
MIFRKYSRPAVPIVVVLATLFATSFTRAAVAFTVQSPISKGCHEAITQTAFRAVRSELTQLPSLTPDRDVRALIEDVSFTLDDDMRDLGAATLLIAVRDNDLQGHAITQLDELASVHGNPNAQKEHCLRHPENTGPNGDKDALDLCRGFIREKVGKAINGLNAAGLPDPEKKTHTRVALEVRGTVDVDLPTFYVEMGNAVHAMQDSFTHTYRNQDGTKVQVVLNWVRVVDGNYDEKRDGPSHQGPLDSCDDSDPLHVQRHRLAIRASSDLLRAALSPGDRDAKLANVDRVINDYLSYAPGCTYDNHWCNAPEEKYRQSSGCGCHLTPGRGVGIAALAPLALSLAAWIARRRRRTIAVLGSAALLSVMVPRRAFADEATPQSQATAKPSTEVVVKPNNDVLVKSEASDKVTVVKQKAPKEDEVSVKTPVPKVNLQREESDRSPFGVYLALSGSLDHLAAAASIGPRYRIDDQYLVGLDGEWNPFFASTTHTLRPGVANFFLTGIRRWPMKSERFDLRTSAHLGTSTILYDLYGVPKGSTGPFIGLSVIAIEWKYSRLVSFVFEPASISMPIPKVSGAPFLYLQYRITLGLQFGA